MAKKIIFIGVAIANDPNRTQYQRAHILSKNFDAYIYLANPKIQVPVTVSNAASLIRKFAYPTWLRFLFPFWCLFNAWRDGLLKSRQQEVMVYTTFHSTSVLSGFLFKTVGFRWILDIWDHPQLPILEYLRFKRKKWMKLLFLKLSYVLSIHCIKFADLFIIALSPSFREILHKLGVPEGKVHFVPNGCDIARIDLIRKVIAKKEDQNYIKKRNFFSIVYIGCVSMLAGVNLLVEAVDRLKKEIPNIQLILIGDYDPKEEKWLKNILSSDSGLNRRILVTGYLRHKEAMEYLASATICAFPFPKVPQYDYIYPIKILEYMAMEKIVIASKLEGVSTLIQDRENGFLFPPGDIRTFCDIIIWINRNWKNINGIKREAYLTAQKYDWTLINSKIVNIINSFY